MKLVRAFVTRIATEDLDGETMEALAIATSRQVRGGATTLATLICADYQEALKVFRVAEAHCGLPGTWWR